MVLLFLYWGRKRSGIPPIESFILVGVSAEWDFLDKLNNIDRNAASSDLKQQFNCRAYANRSRWHLTHLRNHILVAYRTLFSRSIIKEKVVWPRKTTQRRLTN